MHGKKIYILFALLGMAALIVCFVVGALNKFDWLILMGFVVCAVVFVIVGVAYVVKFIRELNVELKENSDNERTPETEQELLDRVNSATDGEESMKAQAVYYGGGAENAGDLIASAFGFSDESKKAFKNSSLGEKMKVIVIFVWFGITLLTFFTGIILSNVRIQPAGFIVMGVGGGLFFLTIIGFTIFSLTERRGYFKGRKPSKRGSSANRKVIRTGVVKRCELHGQFKVGNRTPKVGGTLYQVWVWTSDKEPLVRLICLKRYNKYDKVRFYEIRGIRIKRRIIEE